MMTLAVLGYFAVTLGTLLALARMILQVGRSMADCPQTGAAAQSGAIAVASGFLAIGFGGVILTAATIPAVACLTLGLGFAHALRNLRAIVAPPKATPMEPVLA
jgi:hypothetical protein